MYKNAIKKSLAYVRPFLIGRLIYEKRHVSIDISSMIVLNDNGDILTTAKNADIFMACADYNETYPNILKEISEAKPKNIPKIEQKYGIKKDTIVGMHNVLIDIADNPGKLKIIKHPYLDLAIITIQNKDELTVKTFPKFKRNKANIGDDLCTVGFAFPEYKAFKYSEEKHKLVTDFEFMNFPIFPTTGMMQRNIADKENQITMFEMSNIIVPGQEGGPVLSKDGYIYGMIIGFRVFKDFAGSVRIGLGINNLAIMEFLDANNIKYEVEDEKKKKE